MKVLREEEEGSSEGELFVFASGPTHQDLTWHTHTHTRLLLLLFPTSSIFIATAAAGYREKEVVVGQDHKEAPR